MSSPVNRRRTVYCLNAILLFLVSGFNTAAVAAENLEQHDLSAEDESIGFPYVAGGISIEAFSDHTFRADDTDEEISDTFAEINLSLTTLFTDQFYLEMDLAFLPVSEPVPGEDQFFDGHGIVLDTLALTYEKDLFWVSAGKGPGNFGIAQSAADGIWAGDIAYFSYAVRGRVGLAGTVNMITDTAGSHSFYLGTFFLDTSNLSKTWITSTGPNRLEDGGPSNTESLKSFVFAVDGSNIPGLTGFRYHFSSLMQRTERLNDDVGNPVPNSEMADEYRIAIAGEWSSINLSETIEMSPLLEYVKFWNARGFRDDTEDYLTVSLGFNKEQWNVALAAVGVRLEDDGVVDDIVQAEVSLGYLFTNGIKIDTGYRYLDVTDESSHTFGMALAYLQLF